MRMNALIGDLQDYSTASRVEAVLDDIDVKEAVNNVLELMKPQLEENNVSVSIDDRLPHVYCAKAHITEIFRNLITNGIKYNDSDPKKIEIGFLKNPVKHPEPCLFYVRDNGIGIPEQDREAIFKMSARLHGRDQYGGGTGAGLAIVKELVERNQGRIWTEANPDGGSTFYFYIDGSCQDNGLPGAKTH
jgi:chemotaxis family two-component system sensor kinase Cph1